MGSYSAEEYFYKMDNMVLSGCQHLRKLFQARWKKETGKDWEHTEDQGQQFIDGVGKAIYKKAQKLQKLMIAKGSLDDWDMSTLSMVLQNFGDQSMRFENENEAVRVLTRLRNDLAHHSSKKLSLGEYKMKVDSFRKSLKVLQVSDNEIENLIDKAGITSSVAAIKCLDEATTIPSLLPVHQASAFEKRAETYLQLAHLNKQNQNRGEGDKCCEQAILDATAALELNDSSWKAHYLLGQCHRWQNRFELAIQHFHKALAISPVQKHVKKELDACKALAGVRNRQETTDTRNMPMSLQEALMNLEAETGRKMTEDQFLKYKIDIEGKLCEGQDLVFHGHQYAMGWGVSQNDEESARYFAKAAKVGNAEGILNLGLCYRHGKGVAQDLQKAYKFYFQAATMSPDTPGLPTKAKKNNGVASAQHYLGYMYEHGIFVEQDHFEALVWYMKAAENGIGTSAYNLGLMFATGKGVPKNEKKAEMYWSQGVIYEEPHAAESLVHYYIKQLEPERARAMFETGKQHGSEGLLSITTEELDILIQSAVRKRSECESDVIKYEKEQQLDIKGMTFLERFQRWSFKDDPKHHRLFQIFQGICSQENQSWGGKVTASDLEQIARLGHAGSITAKRVLATINASLDLVNFIIERDLNSLNKNDKEYVLNLLYECCILEFHLAAQFIFFPGVKDKLKRLIGQLFDTSCDEKGGKSEQEMKIRFCYVSINKAMALDSTDTFMTELLKQGVKLYPENLNYYHLLTNTCGLCRDHKSGLFYAEKGLEKFPDDPDLLNAKAGHLRLIPEAVGENGANMNKIIAAYNQFLTKAPPDHRQVPEAFYTLASLYAEELLRENGGQHSLSNQSSVISKVELHLKLGKESEVNMLPCYLPYGESNQRKAVELILLSKSCNAMKSKISSINSHPPDLNQASSHQHATPSAATPNRILERKQYLTNPERKRLILEHRTNISQIKKEDAKNRNKVTINMTHPPKLIQTVPKRMCSVTPIKLKDMNPTIDHIYQDRLIDLTIVEDPCLGFGPKTVHLLVEDENGDLSRLYLYNVNQANEREMLSFGCTITILNPYMRIGLVDGTNGIRNDEPRCVVYLEKKENMCRFCGEENATQKCTRCKRAWYCSRECQTLDWEVLKHKLICSK